MTKLPPETQNEVWQEAFETAPEGMVTRRAFLFPQESGTVQEESIGIPSQAPEGYLFSNPTPIRSDSSLIPSGFQVRGREKTLQNEPTAIEFNNDRMVIDDSYCAYLRAIASSDAISDFEFPLHDGNLFMWPERGYRRVTDPCMGKLIPYS